MESVTIPHMNFIDSDEESLRGFMRSLKLGEKDDLAAAKMVSDGFSHKAFGASPTDAVKGQGIEGATARAMLDNINFSDLSGDTPFEKAAAYSAALKANGGLGKLQQMMASDPQSALKMMQRIKSDVANIQRIKRENEFADKIMKLGNRPELKLPKLTREQREIMDALSQISEIGQLKTTKKRKLVRKEGGTVERFEPMENYEQLFSIPPTSFVLPDFRLKLAEMDFDVPTEFGYEDVKQAVMLAIDISGSMEWPGKQSYVKALLLHFFNGVKKNNTTLWVGKFEKELFDITPIFDEFVAEEYYEKWENDGGGNTNVGGVITKFQADVKAGKVGDFLLPDNLEPELVIINDGDDYVDMGTSTEAPVHAIILGRDNDGLKTVCEKSSGSYNKFLTVGEQDDF